MGWILVLTLLNYDGPAVTTAVFETQAACMDAGNLWMAAVRRAPRTNAPIATCHPTRK